MENTCGDPGDALKNVSTSGLVRTLKTADDSSSLSLTLQYPSFLHPPLLSLFKYHMENFSSPQSKARKKSTHLDSSTAAVVIDRDVAVFILKCWTKQIALNLPMCKQ